MRIRETILALILSITFTMSYSQSSKLLYANFNYTIDNEISPLTFQFVDSSISQNQIVKWEWSFGNGETSLQQSPEHQYLNSGTYIVSLKVTDQIGLTDTTQDTIIIKDFVPPSCNAFFTYILDTAGSGFTYKFYDHSIHTNDSIISWTWNFGDGTSVSHLQNPIHQYSNTGTFLVSLSIATASYCNSFYLTYITVNSGGANCTANFTFLADTNSITPNTILFHDNSLHNDAIIGWTWYFGDGDSSNYQDPTHSYDYPGIYKVKLKIITASCSDEIEIPIQVGNPQKYNLWGRVYVGNLTTDKCIAFLYRYYQNNLIEPIDTVKLTSINDTLGVYYFYQILEGNLRVRIVLPPTSQYASSFAPTYYNSSPLWQFSQNIPLFQNLGMQNVNMQSMQLQIGTNYIEGSVNNTANGQVKNVLMLLENDQNDIIDYTFTDINGHYNFKQVPQGQFYIYADLAGFNSSPATGNFTSNNDSLFNVDFIINKSLISAYTQPIYLDKENGFDIYPNPNSEGRLNIHFHKTIIGTYNYKIYNAQGTLVQQENNTNATSIDISKLEKGIYLINVIDSKVNYFGTKRIILQ